MINLMGRFSNESMLLENKAASSMQVECNKDARGKKLLRSLTEYPRRLHRSLSSSTNISNRPSLRRAASELFRKNPVSGVESSAKSAVAEPSRHKEASSVRAENQRIFTPRKLRRHPSEMSLAEWSQQGIYNDFTLQKIIGDLKIDSFDIEIIQKIKGMAYLATWKKIASGKKDTETAIKELKLQLGDSAVKEATEQGLTVDAWLLMGVSVAASMDNADHNFEYIKSKLKIGEALR